MVNFSDKSSFNYHELLLPGSSWLEEKNYKSILFYLCLAGQCSDLPKLLKLT
jgi:hypothetical protein